MAKVKIRFLGERFYKGIPQKRHIDIGGERFYNYNRFPEQLEDGSYVRPVEFYEKHRDTLGDKRRFIIEFLGEVSGALGPKGTPPEPEPLLTPELREKGVEEIDGILGCPHCHFISDEPKKMAVHLVEHGK